MLLAAIYVDPMHRVVLNDSQLERGKKAAVDIAVCMNQIKNCGSDMSEEQHTEHSADKHASTSSSEDDFEKQLDQQAKAKHCRLDKEGEEVLSLLSQFKAKVVNALTDMEKIDRESKMDVMNAIPHYPPMLQKLAFILTALPPTQVSVERLFSAL